MIEKIGFMDGSFDQIHHGHLIMASLFVEHLGLDFCYFVPAKVSPAKQHTNAELTAEHRLKMVSLATQGNPKFKLDYFEIKNDSVSYTYLTVQHFKEIHPQAQLFMLIGTDQAKAFDSWRNYEFLIDKLEIAIAGRLSNSESNSRIEEIWKSRNKCPIFIPTPEIEISSEMLRSRLARGLSIEYYAPREVAEYASKCGIYKAK